LIEAWEAEAAEPVDEWIVLDVRRCCEETSCPRHTECGKVPLKSWLEIVSISAAFRKQAWRNLKKRYRKKNEWWVVSKFDAEADVDVSSSN